MTQSVIWVAVTHDYGSYLPRNYLHVIVVGISYYNSKQFSLSSFPLALVQVKVQGTICDDTENQDLKGLI